jgi:Kef-type K+ transport system membrane component KefB
MNAHQVGQMMLALAVVIVLTRVFGALARRVGQPAVVGEILAGVLVGPTLFGTTVRDMLFPSAIGPALEGLANVGLVLFMFIVGYELDYALVRGKQKVAAAVSIGSIALPMGLGATLAVWLAHRHHIDRPLPFVLFMGAAMSVTAFPVLARILTDRGMHRIAVGGLALASAAVDDVIAWSMLALVIAVAASGADTWHVLFAVPFVLLMFLVVRPLLRRVSAAHARAGRLSPSVLAIVLVGLLLSCYAAEWLGVHVIFGAFLFGVVMPRTGAEPLRYAILERLEQVSVLLLLPVFFLLAGVKVNLSTVDLSGLLELLLILLVAVVGKFTGAYLGGRAAGLRSRQAGALGALMNTRGLTEIVILTVGLQLHILDQNLFSLMVVMALVTTAMTGPLLTVIYPPRRIEREIAEAERAALDTPDAHRVLVVVDGPDDDAIVELAGDLVGARRPAEVVLSHLVQYQPRLELGGGLSGELLEMTRVMAELDRLADQVRARGLTARVLTRLSTDPVVDLQAQVAAVDPHVVVVSAANPARESLLSTVVGRLVTVGETPAAWPSVAVRVDRGEPDRDVIAALQVAAHLAAAHEAELVVDAAGRLPRRVGAAVDELTRQGRRVRLDLDPGQPRVVVTAGALAGAHFAVRSEHDLELDEPAGWIALLPRVPAEA